MRDDASPPTAGLSDWSRRPLGALQLEYAAGDVAALPPLAAALARRTGPQRLAWAQEESLSRLTRALVPTDPLEAWRRIPAAWVLTTAERQALCHLAAWREVEAERRNLKPWGVVSDAVLVDIVRRDPRDLGDLAGNRLMPKGVVKRHGERLLELLRETPERDLAPLADTPRRKARQHLLRAWAHGAESRLGIAAGLVLPLHVLDRVLTGSRGWPSGTWRDEALGEELDALLRGELGLVLDLEAGAAPTRDTNS